MRRSQLRELEEPERGEVGNRLVQMPGHSTEIDILSRVQLDRVMVRTEQLGYERGVFQFVRGAGEPNRERLQRFTHIAGHQRRDEARVQAAAEHDAERHVAHQAKHDRFFEQLEQSSRCGPGIQGLIGLRGRIRPVRVDVDTALFDDQAMSREQFGDACH